MTDNTKTIMDKLHAPFDVEQRTAEVTVPKKFVGPDGGVSWDTEVVKQFPPHLYASRLNDVFGHSWDSKVVTIDYWGKEYLHVTIEARLPGGTLIRRTGLSLQPFETACNMFGIGGPHDQIAQCGRAMNMKFGLNWNIQFAFFDDNQVSCTITVTESDGEAFSRVGITDDSDTALENAFAMFGFDPDPIPF